MKKIISLIFILFFLTNSFSYADRISELKEQQKEVAQKITYNNKILLQNTKSTRSILYKITILNDQITTRENTIKKLNSEIRSLNIQISSIKKDYDKLEEQLEKSKNEYVKTLSHIKGRNLSEEKLLFIFSAKSLNQLIRRTQYLNQYTKFLRKKSEKISEDQKKLDLQKKELENKNTSKKLVLSKILKEKQSLQKEQTNKKALVADLKTKNNSLKKEIAAQKLLANNLNKQIEKIMQEEASKAKNNYSKNSNTATEKEEYKEDLKLSSDFSKNRGKLPWPISGKGTIVVHYGEQKYQDLKYVKNNSKSIEIRTDKGSFAASIFDGVVTKVFSLPGLNQSVIIRHGAYLSVYANLKSVYLKPGDKVKTKQFIGEIYTDFNVDNWTILYFQLWKNTTRLNPEIWIHK